MTTTPEAQILRYDPVAMVLHWTIATLILIMLPMGFLMGDAPMSMKFILFNLHKSTGLLIIALSIFRFIWRLLNPPPALPDDMPMSQKLLAHAAHWGLYAFIIAMPMTGWIMVSATPKFPILFFGIGNAPFLPMPQLADAKATGHQFAQLHYYFALAGIALIVAHVGAALQHHYVKHDMILRRMLPRWKRVV